MDHPMPGGEISFAELLTPVINRNQRRRGSAMTQESPGGGGRMNDPLLTRGNPTKAQSIHTRWHATGLGNGKFIHFEGLIHVWYGVARCVCRTVLYPPTTHCAVSRPFISTFFKGTLSDMKAMISSFMWDVIEGL